MSDTRISEERLEALREWVASMPDPAWLGGNDPVKRVYFRELAELLANYRPGLVEVEKNAFPEVDCSVRDDVVWWLPDIVFPTDSLNPEDSYTVYLRKEPTP